MIYLNLESYKGGKCAMKFVHTLLLGKAMFILNNRV